MGRTQHLRASGSGLLGRRDGVTETRIAIADADVEVAQRQLVPPGEGVRMVPAEDPVGRGHEVFQRGNRFLGTVVMPVPDGEPEPRGERLRMLTSGRRLLGGDGRRQVVERSLLHRHLPFAGSLLHANLRLENCQFRLTVNDY
jgi:hypothetical protein